MSDLTKEIQYIKGVGPNRVKLLNNLNIFTLKDLITYYPRDYEDRSKPVKIEDLEDGKEALIAAIPVAKMNETRIRNRKMVIYKLIVEDETGRAILTWYNQSYLKNRFKVGEIYHFFGKVKKVQNRIEMLSPVFDEETKNKNTGKIIPIYPLTYDLSQNVLRGIIENAITLVNNKLPETLPKYILHDYKLLGANEAIKKIHFPENFEELEKARKRLVFEELLGMQLALLNLKNAYESDNNGIQFSKDVKMSDVINTLPFKLTKAQLRVLEEIDKDMESNKNMNRLLQGDVGSGKTAVSIIASYKAVKCGYQVAIMAPTAILASQHLESFKEMLDKFGIRCELLVSSITKKKKEEIKRQLESDIGEALNTGEKVEDVISRMGEADEITKAFNQSFSEEEKKEYSKERRNRRFLQITGVLAVLILLCWWTVPKNT